MNTFIETVWINLVNDYQPAVSLLLTQSASADINSFSFSLDFNDDICN